MKGLQKVLAIVGAISLVVVAVAGVFCAFSDKIYKKYLPCDDDFDMLGY